MTAAARFFWQLLPAVRRAERGRFLFFAGLNVVISASQTVGLAGSEALFLGRLGASHLPTAFIVASLATVVASLIYAAVVGRTRNDDLQVGLLLGFGVVLAVCSGMLWDAAPWLLVTVYCLFYIGQAIFVNLHFWTFAADFFDTLSSKRLFPLFAVSSSIGGFLGGSIAMILSRFFPAEVLIPTWGLGLAAAGILTRLAAQSLRRWTPVGQHEADESSVEGIRSALRFIQGSALARGLVVSMVGMIFSLFLLQYLYMDVFARTFDSPQALAEFFGIYLAASNVVELVVAHSVTPFLIRRLGVAPSNLAHPLLTLGTFVVLFFDPRLYTAVLARANRELLNDALAGPIRTLTFNALPYRFRGRVRAFIEGIVSFGAMSIAGAALLLVGTEVDSRWLVIAGIGSAALYIIANVTVRREYLRSLIAELRLGRLDLEELRTDMGASELDSLAERWEGLMFEERERPSAALLEMAPVLADRGLREPLYRAVTHPHPRVRATCLRSLGRSPDKRLAGVLTEALSDSNTEVRLIAIEVAGRVEQRPSALTEALRHQLLYSAPQVRAAAAQQLGREGELALGKMADDADREIAIPALDRLPLRLLDHAKRRLSDSDPLVRGAALDCATRLAHPHPLSPSELLVELRHEHPRVRLAAARALAAIRDAVFASELATALDDESREVRAEAARSLGTLGEAGAAAAAAGPLSSLRMWTADAAIRAVELANVSSGEAILARAFAERVQRAWYTMAATQLIPTHDTSLPMRFLRATLESARDRHCWVAFRLLETQEDPAVLRSIQKALASGPSRQRSDALELLSNLGDRAHSALLALLYENSPVEDALGAVRARVALPQSFDDVLVDAEQSETRWLRIAAAGCIAVRNGSPIREETTMESLLALRSVALFSGLSFDQLEAVKRAMREVQYVRGESVVTQGDRGDDLFVLLEGEAQAYKSYGTPDQRYLRSFTPVSYFGEIAVLDSEPRSATVIVSRDARLLTLDGERFKELILQAPEIAFKVFRMLTARIREAETR